MGREAYAARYAPSVATPDLRASDADRDRAVQALNAHFAAGRLTAEEHEERTTTAYAARTLGELTPLLADLPATPVPPADDEEMLERRRRKRREFAEDLAAYVIVNVFLIGIWAFGGAGSFWPGWVILGWGIGVAFHAWNVFGPGRDDPDDEGEDADRRARHRHRHGRLGRPLPPLPRRPPGPPGSPSNRDGA